MLWRIQWFGRYRDSSTENGYKYILSPAVLVVATIIAIQRHSNDSITKAEGEGDEHRVAGWIDFSNLAGLFGYLSAQFIAPCLDLWLAARIKLR